jgi:pyridinium-3,5-bisthiocarboxylic acid mononucleotide nickel chelatase
MSAVTHVHLDPIGGIAGDMFAAAMADAFPERVPGLMAQLKKLGDGEIRFAAHADASLRGQRFIVEESGHPGHHHHVPHREIQARLAAAGLGPEVLRHALALFQLLAEAEGEVHGVPADAVEFHEIGAWDSIVDFVAAAYFIASLAPARWSCAPIPLGGGRVNTAHGVLPVPAPATTLLLRGLNVIDDGLLGERVTPTGAAIVRYLVKEGSGPDRSPRTLASSGHGFGTRKLPGMANVLRCLAFTGANPSAPADEEIALLQFEIDDQTAEDLAVAMDRIREMPGVLDASQMAVYGKKGRLATQVQVLTQAGAADAVADACLVQTTTLGVRLSRLQRRRVPRDEMDAGDVRVKVARRPEGKLTAKAEMDDIARVPGERSTRQAARHTAESEALARHTAESEGRPRHPRAGGDPISHDHDTD